MGQKISFQASHNHVYSAKSLKAPAMPLKVLKEEPKPLGLKASCTKATVRQIIMAELGCEMNELVRGRGRE